MIILPAIFSTYRHTSMKELGMMDKAANIVKEIIIPLAIVGVAVVSAKLLYDKLIEPVDDVAEIVKEDKSIDGQNK